jgi:hypothetical protein
MSGGFAGSTDHPTGWCDEPIKAATPRRESLHLETCPLPLTYNP